MGEMKPLKAVGKSMHLVKSATVKPMSEAAPIGKTPSMTSAMVPRKIEKSFHEAKVNPTGVGKRYTKIPKNIAAAKRTVCFEFIVSISHKVFSKKSLAGE